MYPQHANKRQRLLKQRGKRINFVTLFSKELSFRIFSFLCSRDLSRCAAVHSTWARLANDELLWRPLFYHRFLDSLVYNYPGSSSDDEQRISANRYGGSWKTKFKVHKNWQSGNCHENTIDVGTDTRIHRVSRQLLEMTDKFVFVVSDDYFAIDVWQYTEDTSRFLRRIRPHFLRTGGITFIKLITGDVQRLVIGHRNGGFTLWEIESVENDLKTKEVSNYNPGNNEVDSVICMSISFPVIMFCTESMRLSTVYVEENNTVRVIQQLRSGNYRAPIAIDVYKIDTQKWIAVVFTSIYIGHFATSAGLQQITISPTSLHVSRWATALDSDPLALFPNWDHYADDINNITGVSTATSMVYSPPNLIMAHSNNTIKQYTVSMRDNEFNICFKRTLYGHTFGVDALALKRGKLLSADRSGIKIWNLFEDKDDPTVIIKASRNLSYFQDLPFQHTKSICFDEDRIVAFINDEKKSRVRFYFFHSS